jgi:hypothetical protein
MLGGIPTSSVKLLLKVPIDEQPTACAYQVRSASARRRCCLLRTRVLRAR